MAKRSGAGARGGRLAVVVLLAGALAVGGCGSDGAASSGTGGSTTTTIVVPDRTDRSPRFTLGALPGSYRAVWAGEGQRGLSWGDDSTGTDQPWTVLAPAGAQNDPAATVLVGVAGYEGTEGGLAQVSRSYLQLDEDSGLQLGGRDALYAVDDDRARPGELVADRGDDLAVVVQGPADRDLLVAVAEATTPTGHETAPDVTDPPGELEIIGAVHADLQYTVLARVTSERSAKTGPRGSHAASLLADDGSSVVVTALAGDHAELAALGATATGRDDGWTVAEAAVDGRPAVLLEQPGGDSTFYRTLAFHDVAGNLFVLTAARNDGAAPLDRSRLITLAESIEVADQLAWDEFVVAASGGDALDASPGTTELARGNAEGVPYLFVATESASGMGGQITGPVGSPCLALTGRRQVCGFGGTSSAGDGAGGLIDVSTSGPDPGADLEPSFPAFAVVTTTAPATAVRITTANATVEAPFHEIEGTPTRRSALAFIDATIFLTCGAIDAPTPDGIGLARVDLLDDAGEVLACAGGLGG